MAELGKGKQMKDWTKGKRRVRATQQMR
jgi:hypothetical protein